jgi:hypothetical protein
MTKTQLHVVDPISPEDAAAPAELLKRDRFGEELAQAMADITCEQHGLKAKAWHVGVELRHPIAVRDRFFVTLDADARRVRDIGPMSADIANHLLMFIESGMKARLPGTEAGTISREVVDLSKPSD